MVNQQPMPPMVITEAVLRDLDVLLRKKLGENLIVDKFTTVSLVSAGENYGSSMLKVDVEFRRDGEKSKPEKLYLVAKMVPPTDFQRVIFDSPATFPKETYMFTDIMPAYQSLERECGIPENEISNLLPELYGARLSLDEGSDKFDNDAVILMDNLKLKNYYCGNRINGLNLTHAKAVVQMLARFHSLSIGIKIKKPQLFEEFKKYTYFMVIPEEFGKVFARFIVRVAENVPSLLPHLFRIRKFVSQNVSGIMNTVPVEPWASIIHTDLWVNNVMLRDDANGYPEDAKLVDFQNYAYGNPLRDLIFFFFTSCNKEVRTDSIENLIDLYYDTFIMHLTKLNCDTSPFTRKSFDEQFADAANIEYMHIAGMIRTVSMESDEISAGPPSLEIFNGVATSKIRERIAEFTLRCIKENWI